MEPTFLQTQSVPSRKEIRNNRNPKKPQSAKLLPLTALACLIALALATAFFYGTAPGHQLRKMLAGSILSSQHPQYAFFLLSKQELNELKEIIAHPPTRQSSVSALASVPKRSGPLVKIDTVENPSFTAKVMIVNDPTTLHLVGTKFKNKGEPLSDLIREYGGIGGINAGGFEDDNGVGSGGQPIGIAIGDGKVLAGGDSTSHMLIGGFTDAGQFITGSYSIEELKAMDVTQAVSFGPQLLVNGNNVVTPSVNAAYGWAPRTALGQTEDGSVVMIVTDGRYYHNKAHRGASMEDLVNLFQQYDVKSAFALDGGGSATMIYNGELQLKPATSTDVGMRYLPNAFIVIPHENDGLFAPTAPRPGEDRAPDFSSPAPAPHTGTSSVPVGGSVYPHKK